MSQIKIHYDRFEVSARTGVDIRDVSADILRVVKASGVENGVLTANVIGSTGSITTIEHEPGVVADLARAIDRLAPPGDHYAHEEAWHDGNGHSHVQAALLGPSISVAVQGGRPALGTWQQVVVINHDNKPRKRTVAVTVIGA